MDSYTVEGSDNSHIVTGLSDDANYAVSVAVVNMCGNRTSNDPPILVYGKYLDALL